MPPPPPTTMIKPAMRRLISNGPTLRQSQHVFQTRFQRQILAQRNSHKSLQSQAASTAVPPISAGQFQGPPVGYTHAEIHEGQVVWVKDGDRVEYPASSLSDVELSEANSDLKSASATETLAWAASTGPVAMISSFGAQAAIMLHMANEMIPGIPVISVDTGYLPPETYRYMEELKERLDLNLIVVNNTEWSPARMEAIHGKLWEQDDETAHKLYGSMRKTEPLAAALDAIEPMPLLLLSGLRASQTAARADMPRIARQPDGRLKVLPLLNMTDQDVEEYFEEHDLPQHPLIAQGYVSIGDWHSSRALKPGESADDARKTRFGGKFEECGLHVSTHTPVAEQVESNRVRTALEIISSTPYNEVTGIATHMVKKRLEDGEMCAKCNDVQGKLEKEGTLAHVGGVSIADMSDSTSDGLTIAQHFDEKKAPFFVVKEVDRPWRVVYSYGQWKTMMKKATVANEAATA
eukprot:TRINITY_DN3451_c0_g2_i1.p1 TRINITY_DN3451_c0_g2~~TRINITY_DN3451_c0_g2_i1.p1  ORF type:complete len:464 (+),score=89.75 TRINITY_DN3451_c0_g2_i1:209-1600(+)